MKYQEFCEGLDPDTTYDPEKLKLDLKALRLWHAASGLTGESGEFMDVVKKHVFYGKPLDADHLSKELGDILYYITMAARALEINLDTVMEINVKKLSARYPNGFSQQAAIERKDVTDAQEK